MKVLQVNCVYKKGSTGRITYDLHRSLLSVGIDSIVCYGRGALVNEPGVYKICPEWYSKLNNAWSRLTGIMYGSCFFSTNRLISLIKYIKPDIVVLQCLNGYFVNIYRLIAWLKKSKVETFVVLHAEFMYTANCGFAIDCEKWRYGCGKCPRMKCETKSLYIDGTARSWKKMFCAFAGFDQASIISVSPWIMNRAKQSPILCNNNHFVIYNSIDIEAFHTYDTAKLKRELCIDEKKIVFHATSAFSTEKDHIKGGWYVTQLAKKMPTVQFVVAGVCDNVTSVPDNVILLGEIDDPQIMGQYYSMADLTIITSKREAFSLVVAESLCCGTPVVGFKAGAPESIAIQQFTAFVEHGDLDSLYEKTVRFLLTDFDKSSISEIARGVYIQKSKHLNDLIFERNEGRAHNGKIAQ